MLRWLQNHPTLLEHAYSVAQIFFKKMNPFISWVGYGRMNRFLHWGEAVGKKAVFDCRMCGQCILHSTGMTCPMTCPKNLRNGPCGGVRMDGHCEVIPQMRCVWVEAWRGSQQMRDNQAIQQVQIPVNNLLKGSSSWLRVVRHEYAAHEGERIQ